MNTPLADEHLHELAEKFIMTCRDLGKNEHAVLHHLSKRKALAHNTNLEFDGNLTFGQKVADKIASFGGSWTFILLFLFSLFAWVLLNSFILVKWGKAFDPYPYILLNLFLSMLASLQAPVIMMSQNRQSAKDRLDAEHDYEVNLKAEIEILSLHQKVDLLREQQWEELVKMQQEQIRLLTELVKKQ